jgi:hypothetical protein
MKHLSVLLCLLMLVSVGSAQQGSLQITLYAEDPWGLAGNSVWVKLYDNAFVLLGEQQANTSSTVTFYGLPVGTYQYEVYNKRVTAWGDQYWGWKGGIVVVAGAMTFEDFKHNTPFMPFTPNMPKVYINNPNQFLPDGARVHVPAGTLMRVEIDVMNPNYDDFAETAQVFVRMYLDRDKERKSTAPYTFDFEGGSPVPPTSYRILKGTTLTTANYFTTPENGAGAYYLSCGVFTWFSGGGWMVTDGGGWIDPAFTIVGTTEVVDTTPEKFTVLQNYPNPFNPTTAIEYTIRKSGLVQLIVVDILGRETILVDEIQSVGTYRRVWTAQASGTYFAVLRTSEQRQVISMSAVK